MKRAFKDRDNREGLFKPKRRFFNKPPGTKQVSSHYDTRGLLFMFGFVNDDTLTTTMAGDLLLSVDSAVCSGAREVTLTENDVWLLGDILHVED